MDTQKRFASAIHPLVLLISLDAFYLIRLPAAHAVNISRYLVADACTAISLVWVLSRAGGVFVNH
jgi:hypothetical protein